MNAKDKKSIFSTALGSVLNLALAFLKFWLGIATNCVSIMVDAINNFGDVVTGALSAVGIGLSKKKPTKEFPHGFGKIEYVVTLFVSAIFLGVGMVFIYMSAVKITFRTPVSFYWSYFGILAGTMGVKVLMGLFFLFYYKKTNSPVVKTFMLDSFLDSAITLVVLVGYLVGVYTAFPVDGILGVLLGILFIFNGAKIFWQTLEKLLDKRDEKYVFKIKKILDDEEIVKEYGSISIYDMGEDFKHAIIEIQFVDFCSKEQIEKFELETLEKYNVKFIFHSGEYYGQKRKADIKL